MTVLYINRRENREEIGVEDLRANSILPLVIPKWQKKSKLGS
jgi:hypothetical protein